MPIAERVVPYQLVVQALHDPVWLFADGDMVALNEPALSLGVSGWGDDDVETPAVLPEGVVAAAREIALGSPAREILCHMDGREKGRRLYRLRIESIENGGAVVVGVVTGEEVEITKGRAKFLNRIAHDLKSPLTTAMLMTDLAGLSDTDEEKREEYLGLLKVQLNRERDILEDLLCATRFEEMPPTVLPAPVDLARVLARTAESAQQMTAEKRISFALEISPKLPIVDGDETALARAFLEIVKNSAAFTTPEGEVRLEAESVAGGVAVRVLDTGVGISGEDLPRVFEPYFRGGNVTPGTPPGAGIGLAAVRVIIEGLGGRVGIESGPGEGTRCEVFLRSRTWSEIGEAGSQEVGKKEEGL